MATRMAEAAELAARVQRAGWPVTRMTTGGGGWKVKCPNGETLQIHLTPSDRNFKATILRDLNARGFDKAEAAAAKREAGAKAAAEERDRRENARKAALAAKRSAALAKAAGPYGTPQPTLVEILRKHPRPIVWLEVLVTPAMAAAMLGVNTHNRPESKGDNAERAGEIRQGRFLHTHQGIAFDRNGVLIDGQGRLKGIVAANEPAVLMVSAGWPPENFALIDTGRRRTAAQLLTMHGLGGYSAQVGAAAKLLYLYETWGPAMLDHTKDRVANDLVMDVVEKMDPDDRLAACRLAGRLRTEIRTAPAGPTAAFYLIAQAAGPAGHATFERFAEDLIRGKRSEDDPTSVVHRRLWSQQLGAVKSIPGPEVMALIIRGWNWRVTGQRGGRTMVVRDGSPMPSPLPPVVVES